MYHLRPYQAECLKAIGSSHMVNDSTLVELATGTGKTVIFTRYAATWEHGRTLVICPFLSIISQTAKKLLKETGEWPAIEQGSQWSNEVEWARAQYVVASKDSLCSGGSKKRYERFQDVGLVIIDEAHYAATQLYADMIGFFRSRGAKILGVTATPKRHDKRALGQIFDDCAFQYGIIDAIDDGYLVPVRSTCLQLEHLDLANVATAAGFNGRDFVQTELNEKLEDPKVIYEIAEATAQETAGRKTVIYCASVAEAEAVSMVLQSQYRINADWICSDEQRCSKIKRHQILESFTTDPSGISHVCNVGILTTGWDFPDLECIVNARPTKSKALYTQIFGRLTRPCEIDGMSVVDNPEFDTPESRRAAIVASRKPYGHMIDLVDSSLRHKIMTAIDVLGGKWELEVQQRVAADILNQQGPVDMEAKAQEIRDEIERRRAEERERKRQWLLAREAKAKFHKFESNPYGGARANIEHKRRTAAQNKGRLTDQASDAQLKYLWVLGVKDSRSLNLTKGAAGRLINLIKQGKTPEEAKRLCLPRDLPTTSENATTMNEIFAAIRD